MKIISKKMVKPECFEDLKTPGIVWQIMHRDQLYERSNNRKFWVSTRPPKAVTFAQIKVEAFENLTCYKGGTVIETEKTLIFEENHIKDLSEMPYRIWGYLDSEAFFTEIIGMSAR